MTVNLKICGIICQSALGMLTSFFLKLDSQNQKFNFLIIILFLHYVSNFNMPHTARIQTEVHRTWRLLLIFCDKNTSLRMVVKVCMSVL